MPSKFISPACLTAALLLGGCLTTDDDDETTAAGDTTEGATDGTDTDTPTPTTGSDTDDPTGGETDTDDSDTDDDDTDDTGGMAVPNPCEMLCADMPGTPPEGLGLVKSAGQEPGAHCSTLHVGVSEDASVTVFSETDVNLTFNAADGAEITVTDLQLIPGGADGQDLEWSLLSDAELSLPPLSEDEYVGHTITADDPLSFYVNLKPAASGAREACLALSTEGGDDYLVTLTGRGSEDPMLNFSPHLGLNSDDDVRFGAQTNLGGEIVAAMSNEYQEPGITDSTGASYTIGRNVGPGGFAEVTAIAKRNADGSWAWKKLLEGRDGDNQVDAKQYQVTDSTGDFGSSHAVLLDDDDNLFVVTNVAVTSNSDITQGVVVKLDPDGNVLWTRGWIADPNFPAQANDEANFQAMALSNGTLVVTGQTGGSNTVGAGIPVVGLDAETGDLLFDHVFQIDAGGSQAGLALTIDGDDIYLGGQGARAFVAKLSGLDNNSLSLEWNRRIDLGFTGTMVRSMTMAEGALCGLGRGTSTQNMFHMFCMDTDGNALWNRQLGNLPSSRTRSQVITYAGGSLYAGGAIAVSGLSSFGEGLLLRATTDGDLDWSAIYYTGKGTEEIGFHSVKGITLQGDQLHVQGQAWTGSNNIDWYKGFWYDGADVGLEWSEYAPNAEYAIDYGLGDLLVNEEATLLTDTSAFLLFTDVAMEDPASVEEGAPAYLFQRAQDRRGGAGGDYDGLLQTLTVQ
jgi:hypothetical protein